MDVSHVSLRSSQYKGCTFIGGLPPELWQTILGYVFYLDQTGYNQTTRFFA